MAALRVCNGSEHQRQAPSNNYECCWRSAVRCGLVEAVCLILLLSVLLFAARYTWYRYDKSPRGQEHRRSFLPKTASQNENCAQRRKHDDANQYRQTSLSTATPSSVGSLQLSCRLSRTMNPWTFLQCSTVMKSSTIRES